MTDEKRSAWYEPANDTYYFSMSGLGKPPCQAVHSILGERKVSPGAMLLRAYGEGHELESVVVGRLEDLGWDVEHYADDERELDLTLLGDRSEARLVGHPDATGCTSSEPTVEKIIEIKALSKDNFRKVRSGGFQEVSPTYLPQISAYMLASGLPGVHVAAEKLHDGEDENGDHINLRLGELHIVEYTEPPVSVDELIDMCDTAINMAETGVVKDCPQEYGCPFWPLHDAGGEPPEKVYAEVEDAERQKFETYAKHWRVVGDKIKKLENQRKKIRQVLVEMTDERNTATDNWIVEWTKPGRRFDRKLAEEAGIDLEPYMCETARKISVKERT